MLAALVPGAAFDASAPAGGQAGRGVRSVSGADEETVSFSCKLRVSFPLGFGSQMPLWLILSAEMILHLVTYRCGRDP